MTTQILRSAWDYLSLEEENETDPWLKDDLRIAKLCILELQRGTPDPWRLAFWKYMGVPFEKWRAVQAEREAYQRTLGPTLAEQLNDPLFLSSLEPLVRSAFFPARDQMRIPFEPVSFPVKKAA
jgi:hypothetical protein